MISLALLTVQRAEHGMAKSQEFDAIPASQWHTYYEDLRPHCPSQISPTPKAQRNALRIEVLPSREPRCSRKSPDGRGLAWLLSGGDPLSYGPCLGRCPRSECEPHE